MTMGYPGLGGGGFDSAPVEHGVIPRIEIQQSKHGLQKIPIGSTHIVRGESGAQQNYTARDASQFPGAKRHVLCLSRECRGKKWDSIEECRAAHPPHEIMVRQNELHPIAQWSDEPADRELRAALGAVADESERAKLIARAKKADAAQLAVVAPHMRHTVTLTALPIGLLSDQPFEGP